MTEFKVGHAINIPKLVRENSFFPFLKPKKPKTTPGQGIRCSWCHKSNKGIHDGVDHVVCLTFNYCGWLTGIVFPVPFPFAFTNVFYALYSSMISGHPEIMEEYNANLKAYVEAKLEWDREKNREKMKRDLEKKKQKEEELK